MSIRPNQYVGKLIDRWVVKRVRSRRLGQRNRIPAHSNVDYSHSINLAYFTCGWILISINFNCLACLNTVEANGGAHSSFGACLAKGSEHTHKYYYKYLPDQQEFNLKLRFSPALFPPRGVKLMNSSSYCISSALRPCKHPSLQRRCHRLSI